MIRAPEFPISSRVRAPERLVLRGGGWTKIDFPVRYGLWLHPTAGPVLIDTGYGPRVMAGAERSLALSVYSWALRPRMVPEAMPVEILLQRGFKPGDVRFVLVTHLHADHVAGLRDFPNARFIVAGRALDLLAASTLTRLKNAIYPELLPEDFLDRTIQLETLPETDLPLGLGRGFDIFADGSCLAVDLPGHALGHYGLVWPGLPEPLLYAVDVTWHASALRESRLPGAPATWIMADEKAARATIDRVQAFEAAGGRVVLCHDPAPDA